MRRLIALTRYSLEAARAYGVTALAARVTRALRRGGVNELRSAYGNFRLEHPLESVERNDFPPPATPRLHRAAPRKPRPSSHPHLVLDPEFGIDEASWSEFLGELYARHLRRPPNPQETLTLTGAMWVLVEPPESGDAGSALRTSAAIDLLRQTADFPVRERLLLGGYGELRKFASEMTERDLVVFLKAGDEIRPEFAPAFTLFGAFNAPLTLFDMYFRDQGRIFPLLLHAVDPLHARHCNYFHSRFAVGGEALLGALRNGIGELEPLQIAQRTLSLAPDAQRVEPVHIPLPLANVALTQAYFARRRRELIERWHGPGSAGPIASGRRHSVSVIISTKDRGHLLQQLLERLFADDQIREIIIVSNNTSDPYAIAVLENQLARDRLRILRFDQPFNFSAQCNLGARHASGDFLLFLNDDLTPVNPPWLSRLLEWFVDDRPRLVGPLLLYPDETVQHGGMFLGYNRVAGHTLRHARVAGHMLRHARIPSGDFNLLLSAPRRTSSLTGAALLMSRKFFADLNGFDPLLASYLQDVDLSLRAMRSGAELIFDPRSILLHMESISLKSTLLESRMRRSRVNEYRYFIRRWHAEIEADRWMNPLHDRRDESLRTLVA